MDRKARCRCGSGRQYKACCYAIDRRAEDERLRAEAARERQAQLEERKTRVIAAGARSRRSASIALAVASMLGAGMRR